MSVGVTGVCAFLWVVAGECGWVSCVCRVGTSKELGSCSGSGLVREGFEGYESLCVFFEDENDENDERGREGFEGYGSLRVFVGCCGKVRRVRRVR